MALLDYMFPMGESSQSTVGLLGEDEAKKIRQQSQISGLLNFGAALLANSGPTQQQMSFGQRLAPALLGGYQAAQGTSSQQLQDRLNAQKLAKEAAYNKAIEESFVKKPTTTGLSDTSKGSQAEMLSRPEFGGEFAADSTRAGLLSNPNLPQDKVMDQNKFMNALAQYNPLEFAKIQAMTQKTEAGPAKIREFKALMEMPEAERNAYIQLQKILNPGQSFSVSLAEKGADKVIGERIGEFSSAAASQRRFAQDAQVIASLLQGKGGGDIVKIGTGLAKDLGFSNNQVSAQDLANSIAVRGATTMKAPGSGSTSDLEFKSYTAAFPSLANSEAGRLFMATASTKFAQRSAKISDYAMKLYKDGKYSEEAIAAYDQSLGPVIDIKQMESLAGTKDQKPVRRTY